MKTAVLSCAAGGALAFALTAVLAFAIIGRKTVEK